MFDPRRADVRPIEEKALGLLFAMDDAAAERLRAKLAEMKIGDTAGKKRAAMFCGKAPKNAT